MRFGLYHAHAGTKSAGGKAVFVRQLARELASGHEVVLYTEFDRRADVADSLLESDASLYRIPPVESDRVRRFVHQRTPLGTADLLPLVSGLRSGLRSHVNESVDVLLTHRFLEDTVLSNVVDVPTVYQYHNVASVGLGARTREHCSATDYHLANSTQIAHEVREKLDRDVDGIVSPGLDLERFTPEATPGLHPDAPSILFVGRVRAGKGVSELLESVARLSLDAQLYVVGDGDLASVQRQATDLGVDEAVTLVGEVPHEELPGYYTACDVFCNPTRYEGFGMVNLEAMACGLPVVTTDIPGVREYADHGENALLVSPRHVDDLAAALESILASPSRRDELAETGRETARQYSWASQADRLVAFCRRVLEDEGEDEDEHGAGSVDRSREENRHPRPDRRGRSFSE
ncbi:glycosyltransferase family 4 protein [Natronobacterium gregoryi]|uniref:Glycosyl transferase group 1 n=2 Tax=Natronobacterium gregoryi TaxID=44930 RepID=L0AMG2_NATGS|nr:glycosyltransferase family 4 protein [Natronobacterium gregoryi]AFZ74382.1 glycosyltransferase [Natronobacterium gregoryi SP2]ELY74105.1 glycosyl transferase group 1 [Natronobacterium gregoryi SP2]PLK22107.1 glycosyltransferase family 1 protein [Natronobacterium gregoryi SP2]SFJ61348.1 Glycosyltransferase involved in cell wall bisynthesis [Natronobacterium gregoryi]